MCSDCRKYRSTLIDLHDRITLALDGGPGPASLRQSKEYSTHVGKLIAATASLKGLKLSAVSRAAEFAPDYVSRVCRGDLPLSPRAAKLIGGALGIDLSDYVSDERKPGNGGTHAPELPLGGTSPLKFEVA